MSKPKTVSNWGKYPAVDPDFRSFSNLAELKTLALVKGGVIARGNGRCYGDASLGTHILSTLRYNKFLSFDEGAGILECQSGVRLDEVLEVIVPRGWFLPVTPGTKFITVGGAVASDIHGKNHHVDGSFSNHVVDMDILLASGEIVTCSRELLPELFWASCGGQGLTGVITRVRFRLKKVETAFIRQKQIKAKNLDEILLLFEEYKHYTYSVAWIDCLKKGDGFGRSILMLGEHAGVDDLSTSQKKSPLLLPRKKQINFPVELPSYFLNPFTVKAFNFLFYGKNTRREIDNVVPYEPFFYPLDAILNWNRGYGKKGFVQYQFVLPMHAQAGLKEILRRITDRGFASFLAVLKVFGKQDDMISFPREGYTLALDFPVRIGLFEFLDELDKVVLD